MKFLFLIQVNFILFISFVLISHAFDCTQTVTTPAAVDPNFSPNSCIVIGPYTTPDCNLPPPSRFTPTTAINMCPGEPVTETVVVDGSQTYYTQIEYAIENCPYDPVLIEIVGTHYLTNSSFIYNQSKNIILRGYSSTTVIPGNNITVLVPVVTEVFDNTTNTTTNVTTFVSQINGTQPDTYITLQSMLVGFYDFEIVPDLINITIENLYFKGCGTDRGVFLTLACPESCGDDDTDYCKGAWFPKNSNITNMSLCMQTGAFFNGTQRISFQANVNGDFNTYNGLSNTDSAYFWLQEQFTLEVWVNPSTEIQANWAGVANNYRRGNADNSRTGWGFIYDNTQHDLLHFRVALPNKKHIQCSQTIPPNTWTHVAGVWDRGSLSYYYNGFLVCNATTPRTTPYYGTEARRTFSLGVAWNDVDNGGNNGDSPRYYKGLMDEVRLWNSVRTSAQIQDLYQTPLSITYYPDLIVYMKFNTGPDTFTNFGTAIPGLPTPKIIIQNNFGDNITTVPDCFCPVGGNDCTPVESSALTIPGSVTTIYSTDSVNNYEFINGMTIDPNGIYGMIFLPGVTNTSGTSFNQTVRFIPGIYQNFTTYTSTSSFNSTTNITTTTNTSETVRCLVPGAIPSILPPSGSNQYSNLTFFVPGWFFNNGQPPYISSNFVPGRFVLPTGNGSLPADYQPGDSIFEPGIQYPDGTWVPYSPVSMQYIFAIGIMGGASWHCNRYIDPCVIRPLIIVPTVPPPITVIETALGCTISPDDIEPTYLDPTQRDPCFVLRDVRMAMPVGFETFDEMFAASCVVADDDIEPTYLDPTQRDPCFLLRDVRSTVPANTTLNCTNGQIPRPAIYMPCLKNQNLTIYDSTFEDYYGDRVVCQWACEENVNHVSIRTHFINTPGSAIWVSGMQNYDLHDSTFCPCGGKTEACIYLNANHITAGQFHLYNIRQCAIQDLLPYTCEYNLTPELQCFNGELLCLDIVATLQEDCQQVEVAPGILRFEDECAVYAPCQCNAVEQNITLPDGSIVTVTENTGDVEVGIDFITPLISGLLNGTDFLILSCSTVTENRTFTYPCFVNVTVEMYDPLLNITMNVTVQQAANCTSVEQVTTGSIGGIPCPCPSGFNASATTNLTGSAAVQALGLYSQCEWDIPNGLPGEECLNGIVQCPYLGGELGSGAPPPVPLGYCDAGTVKFSCGSCSGGTIYYENTTYTCPSFCANSTTDVFTLPCQCLDFSITVTCTRDVQCIPTIPCANFTNVTLCAYTGALSFDGNSYPCFVAENATLCTGVSYAASNPGPPPDGQMTIPCTNSYQVPGPGPCSCLGTTTSSSSNVTVSNNVTICNTTIDPNCTNPMVVVVNTGDPSFQLQCTPAGQITCRCDGIQALNPLNGTNSTLLLNSSAIWIDHVPNEGEWFMQNVVTQQLPIGVRFTRFQYDLIVKFALKVLHFFSDHAIMHESGRQGVNPYVTGTVYDWADGYDAQWNFRTCNQLDPGPDEGVYTNECKQYRPLQKDSCVVNSNFDAQQTPNFGTTRFNRINDALLVDTCMVVIVQKASNVYEERMPIRRKNVFLYSYTFAVVVESAHWIDKDNITMRGLVLDHSATNDFPLIQPTRLQDNNFDSAFNGDPGESPKNFRIYNCRLLGHNVNKAGAIIGQFGDNFDMKFNTIESFQTRTVFVDSAKLVVNMNTFIKCTGRAFRTRKAASYIFEENLLIDCSGIRTAKNVEITSFRATGSIGKVQKLGIGSIIFGNLTAQDYNNQFDLDEALKSIDFTELGCNPMRDLSRVCYVRGNRIKFNDESEAADFDTIGFRFIGGAIPPENVRDNVISHAKIGMDFSYTTNISYLDLPQIFKQNALIRVQDTYQDSNGDESADFTARAPGSLVTLGCYFPNCWPNTSYPTIEVNPRMDLIIVDNYGFSSMNNLTDASRWGHPLNTLRVTSERAILRREQLIFTRDTYALGIEDSFCCAKPIIYGSKHQLASAYVIQENLEYRFEITDPDPEATGDKLFETPARYLPLDIRFYRCNFDGRYTIGTGRVRIMNIFIDPFDGVFVLERNHIYNWWHFPLGTRRGLISSHRGTVPVVILPDLETVYYTERSPNIDGMFIYFQPNDRTTRSRYVKDTKKNPYRVINSMAMIHKNNIRDLDGNVLLVSTPGNWEITDNEILDCGMRQADSTSVLSFEGNFDSFGSYVMTGNYINTTKTYLFPLGGGAGNKERVAAISFQGFKFPSDWIFRNNTVALNGPVGQDITTDSVFSGTGGGQATDNPPIEGFDYGWFKRGGPKFFNAPKINAQDPKPNTWDASIIADRNLDNTRAGIIAGTNYDPSYAGVQDPDSFDDPLQRLVPLSYEDTIHFFDITNLDAGYTVGVRFKDVPPQVIVKTLDPAVSNLSMFSFFQPQLYPYRIVAIENNLDAAKLLLNNTSLEDIEHGPGIHGINADIIACTGQKDVMESSFQQCIVCNNGCPVQLPNACYVDPGNATFVPENPYYGTWLFSTIEDALLNCRNPKRVIIVTRQSSPFTDVWNLDFGNWTIKSNSSNPAQILVGTSIQINANNLTISGFEFIHNAGDAAPTLTKGGLIGSDPINITITNCTFNGDGTVQQAVTGSYDSIAFVSNLFINYDSDLPVIDLASSCGMLFYDDNTMVDVKRAALRASNYDISSITRNSFENCGSKATNDMPFCVYVSNCYDTAVSITFRRNYHYATGYNHVSGTPRRAAYWIDGLPLNNGNTKFDLQFNEAAGLDIGLRATNADDLSTSSFIGDPRATVGYLSIMNRNQDVTGTWHYVVWGPPSGDANIEADPEMTKKFYCDNDCGGAYQSITKVIGWSAFVLIVILYFFLRGLTLPNQFLRLFGYSTVINEYVPLYHSVAPVLRKLPDDYPDDNINSSDR